MLLNQLSNLLDQSVKPGSFFIHNRSAAYERHKRTICVFYANRGSALTTFNHYLDLTVVLFLRLQDLAECPYSVDLVWGRFINRSVVLGSQKNGSIGCQGLLKGRPAPYRYRSIGQGATLGRDRGIAEVMGVKVRGVVGSVVTRSYHVHQVPLASRRFRILADGLLAHVFRRDIAELGMTEAAS